MTALPIFRRAVDPNGGRRNYEDPGGAVTSADIPQFTFGENMSRLQANAALAMTSGTIYVGMPLSLPPGDAITSVGFINGSTALAGATHQWAGLLNLNNLTVIAVSADATNAAWAASASKQFTWTKYNVGSGGTNGVTVWPFLCVVATTMPNPICASFQNAANLAPVLGGTLATGQSTPPAVGATFSTPTALGSSLYCWTG